MTTEYVDILPYVASFGEVAVARPFDDSPVVERDTLTTHIICRNGKLLILQDREQADL